MHLWTAGLDKTDFEKFQQRYFDDPAGFVVDCFPWTNNVHPTTYQLEILNLIPTRRRVSVRGPHGLGKAQPHSLLIDTPNGSVRFGDLSPGDIVFGSNGLPIKITGVYERGIMPTYRVTFNDGSYTICSLDHLWTVREYNWKQKKEWVTLSTQELIDSGLTRPNGTSRTRKYMIPTAEPLHYEYKWTKVHPYVMGAWLGDGTKDRGIITGKDIEIAEKIRSCGYDVIDREARTCTNFCVQNLQRALREEGVVSLGAREKYVPIQYLENTIEARKELLRGLLDTDGTVSKDGTIQFCSVSRQLAENVAWLSRSLGGMARTHERTNAHGYFYVVTLTLPDDLWFYVDRKQSRVRPTSQKRYLHRWIDNISLEGSDNVRCISVDADDGLYVANDAIVTHNTALASWAILWFALTRDNHPEYVDWKIPTTASAWRQLTKYLWPEIHKWSRLVKWELVGREPFRTRDEMQRQSLKLNTGESFAVASDDSNTIEGAHAEQLMYVFDESKIIPPPTWDSAEGAMSSGETFWLSISTPGEPVGRFYDIQSRKKGYHDWYVRHVTLQEAMDANRITPEWAAARRVQWGEDSAMYQNRVLGEFAASAEENVIPLSWIEAAQNRWDDEKPHSYVIQIGCDVARMGDDTNVIALRSGYYIHDLICNVKNDTMEIAGLLKTLMSKHPTARLFVDVIGVGSGVFDSVSEQYGERAFPYHAQAKTEFTDISNLWQFQDTYSAMWYNLRDLLNPDNNFPVALPPDDDLTADLVAPKWKVMSNGRIAVESKEKVKERLKRSPDRGEAIAMAFWEIDSGGMDAA